LEYLIEEVEEEMDTEIEKLFPNLNQNKLGLSE